MTTLFVQREVACQPEFAIQRIYRALGVQAGRETTRVLSAPFEALHLPQVGALSREVLITVAEPQSDGMFAWIPVSWRAPDSAAFPVFNGFFGIEPLYKNFIKLDLWGQYRPPFGLAGVLFDFIFGRKIAKATMNHVVDEVSVAIEAHAFARMCAIGDDEMSTSVTDPNWTPAALTQSAP